MNPEYRLESNGVTLELSEDMVEAYITVNPSPGSPWPDREFIVNILNSAGIVTTILEEEISRLVSDKIPGLPVCAARGKKAVKSENGRIEYLFEKNVKEFNPDDMEAVDHKSRNRIKTVSRGERIARLHPPVKGKDGVSVRGELIPAGTPSEVKIPTGANIAVDPEDSSYIIATNNGAVTIINDTRIDILPILEIPGNVDYSVGNIDFTGSLIIRGDILSGFRVNTTGSIQVFGIIEDAEVYAGADIFAHGCAGGQKGTVSAGGSINVKYAVNSKLQAGRDIIADDYLINCVTHADRTISVIKRKGLITGGISVAYHGIEANIIGNNSGLKTILSSGFSAELRQQLSMIDVEQTKNINNLGLVNVALKKISRISMIKKQLPPNIVKQTAELIKMKELIEENINRVLEKHESILGKLAGSDMASIRVNVVMYPGVIINFPDIQKVIKEEIKKSVFRIENGILQSFPA